MRVVSKKKADRDKLGVFRLSREAQVKAMRKSSRSQSRVAEVAVVGLESSTFFAGFALALLFSVAEGSEERFPFFRIIREGWMGVGVGRMGHG